MEEQLNRQPFYRLYDQHTYDGITVMLERWIPVRKTPLGTWLRSQYSPCWRDADFSYLRKGKYLKFVLDHSRKKYCYPTLEEAIENFKHRKYKQKDMLQTQLEQVNICVENLDKLDNVSVESFNTHEGVLLGIPDGHSRLFFE